MPVLVQALPHVRRLLCVYRLLQAGYRIQHLAFMAQHFPDWEGTKELPEVEEASSRPRCLALHAAIQPLQPRAGLPVPLLCICPSPCLAWPHLTPAAAFPRCR